MLWIAISENGLSEPYFRSSKLAVEQTIYQNECIKKRLLPFINKYHGGGKYILWSDKASSHYAKLTISLLKHHEVKFVEKYRNLTNVPQCRPIENFLEFSKQMFTKMVGLLRILDNCKIAFVFCFLVLLV